MGVTGVAIGWTGAQLVVAAGLLADLEGFVRAKPIRPGFARSVQGHGVQRDCAQTGRRSVYQCRSVRFRRSASGPRRAVCGPGTARAAMDAAARAVANLAAPTGDVDILVAPEDSSALRDCAHGLGFVALPGWDAAPDLVLVRYDRASDRWLVLDVSTDDLVPGRVRGPSRGPTEQRAAAQVDCVAAFALPARPRRVLAAVACTACWTKAAWRLSPPRTAAPPRVSWHAIRRWERRCARLRARSFSAEPTSWTAARSGDADALMKPWRDLARGAASGAGPSRSGWAPCAAMRRGLSASPCCLRRRRG